MCCARANRPRTIGRFYTNLNHFTSIDYYKLYR